MSSGRCASSGRPVIPWVGILKICGTTLRIEGGWRRSGLVPAQGVAVLLFLYTMSKIELVDRYSHALSEQYMNSRSES
jgi:hypothetical protein